MKKIISAFLACSLIASCTSFAANAESTEINKYIGNDYDFNDDGMVTLMDYGILIGYCFELDVRDDLGNDDISDTSGLYTKINSLDYDGDGKFDKYEIDILSDLYRRKADVPAGDVNLDGVIDSIDATLTLRYYTEVRSGAYDETDLLYPFLVVNYGDINGDGNVDAADATQMLRIYSENMSGLN